MEYSLHDPKNVWTPAQRNLVSYRMSDIKWQLGYEVADKISQLMYGDRTNELDRLDVCDLVGYINNLQKRVGTETTEVEAAQNKERLIALLNKMSV